MLRDFNPFHCNVNGGRIFGSWVLFQPLNRLYCFRLPLCPRRRAEELETEFILNIQNTICTNKLKDGGKRELSINGGK